jgi:PAS domain S-box-containing protein
VDVRLRAFPSGDREFGRFARAALAALGAGAEPADLQRSLRVRYPVAVVRVQSEFARHGEGPIIWYALRTSVLGEAVHADRGPVDAWAVVDDDRRFVEVSPALARIVELPARAILGHQIEDFSSESDPTIRADIAALWVEFRQRGSIASTVRFNYADGRPRELEYRLQANAAGEGRHRLFVWVVPDATNSP